MKNKIALFGDCFFKGGVSHFIIGKNLKIKGKVGLGFNERSLKIIPGRYSIMKKLSEHYIIRDFTKSQSSTSYIGGVDSSASVLSNILNNDLSDMDIILIQCGLNDYRKTPSYAQQTVLGEYDSIDPNTILGAFNLIIKELKVKYFDKKIIFVLPVYGECKHMDITFKEYLAVLKQKFAEAGYPYISPYDFLMSIKPIDLPIKYLVPDRCHLSLNMMFLVVDYIIEEIRILTCI